MMQNGRINSPKLRPRLSSSEKPKSKNMSTCLEIEVSIKIKYGHEGIMIIPRTTTHIIIFHIVSNARVIIQAQYQVWIVNFIENQQTTVSVIEAIAIYHNIGKSRLIRAFQQVHILNYHIIFHNCWHSRNTYGYGVLIGHRER